MAAYATLASLSFLWGSSFLLIKIASRAFDPFGFAFARVGVAAAALLATSALSGKVWPDRGRDCGPSSLRLRSSGRSFPSFCWAKRRR
jgi:drug/metabolite transporter (DMT)-like permease